jgi:multidrug efflux pump subunit AcrB
MVVDQDRVRQAELSSEQLANALNRVISGSTVTQVRDSIYLVDLMARAQVDERSSIEALTNLQITTPTGTSVPLRELATFQYQLERRATCGASSPVLFIDWPRMSGVNS